MGAERDPPASKPAPPAAPKRRLRRFLRRLFGWLAAALLLLVAFHRPLLRWTVEKAAVFAAKREGLKLNLQVDGSILGGIDIRELVVSGGPGTWLPQATISRVGADYDLWELLRHGPGNFLGAVRLHHASVEMDMRKLPATPDKPKPPDKSDENSSASEPPWPRSVDIQNVNVSLTLADGTAWSVRGLTFRAGDGQPGKFAVEEVRQQPGEAACGPVAAEVELRRGMLAFRNAELPEPVRINEFEANLERLSQGEASLKLVGSLGAAAVRLLVTAEKLHAAKPAFRAAVQVDGLNAADCTRWGLPEAVAFSHATVNLNARGSAASPRELDLDLHLHTQDAAVAGWQLGQATLDAAAVQGAVSLSQFRLNAGANRVLLSGSADLPSAWDAWDQLRWKASLEAGIGDAPALCATLQPASGALNLRLNASGGIVGIPEFSGELNGERLGWESRKLDRLSARVNSKDGSAFVQDLQADLGGGNEIKADASVTLAAPHDAEVNWSAKVPGVERLLQSLAIALPPSPLSGQVQSTGRLRCSIEEVAGGELRAVTGNIAVTGNALGYGRASVEQLETEIRAGGGKVVVEKLEAVLDSENTVSGTAELSLAAPWNFSGRLHPEFSKSEVLDQALQEFKAPALQSGKLLAEWSGTGTLQPLAVQGVCSMEANAVQLATMKEPISLETRGRHTADSLEIGQFTAHLGAYRLIASGRVAPEAIRLEQVEFRRKNQWLVSGHAGVPFSLFSASAPDSEALDVALTVKDLAVGEVLKSMGQGEAALGLLNVRVLLEGKPAEAEGLVEVDLRNLVVPAAGGSLAPGQVQLHATVHQGRLAANAQATQPPLRPLGLSAELPLNLVKILQEPAAFPATPFQAKAELPTSDLSFLATLVPSAVRRIQGTASLSVTASGTLDKPEIQGRIDAQADSIELAGADSPSIRNGRVAVRFDGNQALLEEVSAVLAGGKVRVDGTVGLQNPAKPVLDLKASAVEALLVRDPETSLRANAELTLKGPLAAPQLAGTVEAVRGRVFKEVEFLPLSLPSDLPPLPPSVDRRSAFSFPAPLDRWNFDVAVKTRDPIRLMGNVLRGGVKLDAAIRGTGASPQISGTAVFDDAALNLPYSRMKITRGVATILPESPLAPQLDIRGESRVGAYDVTLYLYGSAFDPKTRFLSVPPLAEPDIAALLATGTTLGGDGQTVAADTAGRAAFLILSQAYRKLFKVKSSVSEDPPKLHLSVEPGSIKDPGGVVGATYELTNRIQVEGRVSSTGSVRGLLRYLVRFGKTAAPAAKP